MIELHHDALVRGGRIVMLPGGVEVPAGQNIALVGINGAGKSTWMMALSGVLRPRGGSIAVKSASTPPRAAFSAQHAQFPSWLTAYEIAAIYGVPWEDLVAMDGLMIEEIRRVRAERFSVGQAQILMNALVLLSGAALQLLDEPYAALDFRRRIALTRILGERKPDRGTVIVASPSVADLVGTCTWMIVIGDGRYRYSGTLEDLVDDSRPDLTAQQQVEHRLMAMLSDSS